MYVFVYVCYVCVYVCVYVRCILGPMICNVENIVIIDSLTVTSSLQSVAHFPCETVRMCDHIYGKEQN